MTQAQPLPRGYLMALLVLDTSSLAISLRVKAVLMTVVFISSAKRDDVKKNIIIALLVALVLVSYLPSIITLAFPPVGVFDNGLVCFHLGAFQDKSYTMCITKLSKDQPPPPPDDIDPMPHPVEG
jgi:hypothetical protein